MSNIVDELWLSSSSSFIQCDIFRMTFYLKNDILYFTIETLIRIGGQLCCSSVANLLQYLCAKNYQNTMQLDKVIAKIKGCIFCPTVYKVETS